METLRGFSYMPGLKKEPVELQYIEPAELDRTWKATRRQRLKEQENKLWKEFVDEKDVVQTVLKDDPYQFLQELPEDKIKELLAIELAMMKKEDINQQKEQVTSAEKTEKVQQQTSHAAVVTFADLKEVVREEETDEQQHTLQIYGNDEEGNAGETDPGESDSAPATVREVSDEKGPLSTSSNNESSKSSENITNIVESSIYCARIKDLRARLTEEMVAVSTTIDCQNISILDREDILKTLKRSTEYTTRYHRIHLYNLQRQTEYIKRQNQSSLPFAKYTQFQAQIIRIVSLHQNLLQALQVYHKSLDQTHCVPPAGDLLCSLMRTFKEATDVCKAVPVPSHCDNLTITLFDDDMLCYCDRLAATVQEYCAGVTSYLQHAEAQHTLRSQKLTKIERCPRPSKKTDSAGKLSMYASESKVTSKYSSGKDVSSASSRYRLKQPLRVEPPSSPKPNANNKNRRPLMRAPKSSLNRQRRIKDSDVSTLVEMCPRLSPERSPHCPPAPPLGRDEDQNAGSYSDRLNEDIDDVSTIVCDIEPAFEEKEGSVKSIPCDVTQLVKQLCGGDAIHLKDERVSGARNAQLLCVKSNSPRATTTPQLLRILEENIQKKMPGVSPCRRTPRTRDRLHMPLTVRDDQAARIFQYRRQFVQHMLTSPMYANSSIGRPWDVLSSVSEQLIDEMLQRCADELEIRPVVDHMYQLETHCP